MKIWAYVILAGILVTAAGTASRFLYKSGYNKAVTEQQAAGINAQNEAIEKRMAEWIATQDVAEDIIHVEEKIVERIKIVHRDVPRIVERIVTVRTECRDLGPEYAGLLNGAVRASNQSSDESSAAAPDVDDSL